MTRPTTIRPLLGLILLGGPASVSTDAQAPVTLTRWEGPASPSSAGRAPGQAMFLLRARARWSPDAPGERDRYELRVTLPDGRVGRRPMRPEEGPGSLVVTFPVPADSVRNLLPEAVNVEVALVDPTTGTPMSNPLVADISRFPNPGPPPSRAPTGPFDWGRPLSPGESGSGALPRSCPGGWRFVRVASTPDRPGFFVATTEATNRQVADLLPDHDPDAGRSDEFSLDAPEQPAINLTPGRAEAYLAALREADPAGVPFRLPTRAEWERAARAGRNAAYWWGDAPVFPDGANFLGPEPGEEADTTAPESGSGDGFLANPWGLVHTFGNVAEWATGGDGGSAFSRMGGHFRSEPAQALEPPVVDDPAALGPDPYVGLRPAFDLDAATGAELIRRQLADDPELAGVGVSFDPDAASATLSGPVPGTEARRRASERLRSLWFLAAVVDEMRTPVRAPGRLASIGGVAGTPTPTRLLGRTILRVPVSASWDGPQPVAGSDWWLNVYGPGGAHWAYRLDAGEPGKPTLLLAIPAGLVGPDGTARVALSLGVPATSPEEPRVVSDLAMLKIRGG
ncbi:SUMF1/EgtB/PvdO family nonheme iron enzyme [Tautonia plasticadhaerens]|uniref:Formylglycine-generating sulfatase enzyme n=1 Tax=Tautonia plasticadhaerens TaxID=2527974 RepID=A0A518GZV6_9BACT|nr:SUMF1/EgtB/PvdO family nonheme iron enzyme [Tautonia plasticadhaerens]QDV34123.1 Formylglycine-generating sulfatase enzyme [Tautonia plasticadhaerens]